MSLDYTNTVDKFPIPTLVNTVQYAEATREILCKRKIAALSNAFM
jgi:hypothetical protein